MRPRARYGFLGALRPLYTPNFIPGTIPPSPPFFALIARLGASNRLREERNGNYVYLSPGHVIFFRNYNPAE